ncbi:hypothetical protein ADIS_0638 [Lunatimonas lonarensis]|uniref:Uncharacterized protein n=1 Tax=Lunatimonas lonarensis TaxID=1232681 RepID=R7ZX53_9BACT|nr:hypothetical protein ADIS_0638 [Lunatimonas lonarensis]
MLPFNYKLKFQKLWIGQSTQAELIRMEKRNTFSMVIGVNQ